MSRSLDPGSEVVRDVAARTDLKTDEVWEHITHCSPCYAEFLEFKKEVRHAKAIRRRTAIGFLAAAAAAIPVVVIGRLRSNSYDRQIGDWNLEASASSRGTSNETGETAAQRADRARGYIRVSLPLGSEPGEYNLQIRKNEDGPALQHATAKAEIVNGHTLARFDVDFSNVAPGSYFAAIRGSGRVWRVYPLKRH